MKLIQCMKCGSVYSLTRTINMCQCGETLGKYLSDNITAAVRKSEYCVIFAIDNGSYTNAIMEYKKELANFGDDTRRDWFFTGWVCTHPSEVVFVDTVDELYSIDTDDIPICTGSTPPSTITFDRGLSTKNLIAN